MCNLVLDSQLKNFGRIMCIDHCEVIGMHDFTRYNIIIGLPYTWYCCEMGFRQLDHLLFSRLLKVNSFLLIILS